MSQSEQLHDANMDEILASIRKIITDDGPEAPDADAFASAALDDFREVGAVLARGRSGGYMHDLTKALAGAPPTDDDILDTQTLDETYAAAEAPPAPMQMLEASAPSLDDDAELFEAELAPVVEVPLAATDANDEEIIEDLGDPIVLGPEIELVEPVEVDAAPIEAGAPAVEPPAAAVEVATAAPATVPTAIEVAVPPPPPPVVSALAEVQGLPAEPAADLPGTVVAAAAELATEIVAETVDANVAPVVEAIAPVVEIVAEAPALEATVEELEVAPSVVAPEASPDPAPEMAAEASSVAAPPPSAGDTEPVPEATPTASPLVASEDVMAAMLKPMLKEWLDANMPGIVAKAMSSKGEPAVSDT